MSTLGPFQRSIRKPVRRAEADSDLLIMLLSFAASVVATRVFLQLTGFPQLGSAGSGLHIAHVLWGGLLLFVATLLPLIFANRWVYPATAVLSGVGVGLFIDEVGKFITTSNDYFYPAAAPIIYGFFLLTVLLYLQVRRRRRADTRSELYYALADLTEAIDQDLDTIEKARIEQRLVKVKNNAAHPNQVQLAQELLDFLRSDKLHVVEHRPNWLERQANRYWRIETVYVTQPRHRAILIFGALLFGLAALADLAQLLGPGREAGELIMRLLQLEPLRTPNELIGFVVRLLLESAVGFTLLASAAFLIFKQDRRGIMLGSIGMLVYLVTVNLFVLYFDQFTFILVTVIEFGFYLSMLRYRRRFLQPREPTLLVAR
jgi:hypothetical protein